MRQVIITDKHGWKRRYLVRDTDGDEDAEKIGVPDGPPDMRQVDWDWLMRDINNSLVEKDIYTWNDLIKNPAGLNIVSLPIKRALSAVFRDRQKNE